MAIHPSKPLIQAIRRYKAGNQESFGDIYHESLAYVTKCVLTVLNRTAPDASEDLKQDIIQDTYLTIATKLGTLQSEEAFFQWAGQIATNHALRTWEKDLRRQEREQPTDELVYELPDERFIPEDILYDREKQQLIRKMLQELPTGQYLCLVEYFYNGLKEAEVAQKLGMPLGTVKTNLSRAKKKLKDIIQTYEKKSGVKLYSMSWLLLLLWKDLFVAALTPAQSESVLSTVVSRLPSASGTVAATGTATVSGAAAASETAGATVTAKAAIPLAAKIAAGVLAAATAIGGIVVSMAPKEEPYNGPGPMQGDLITLHYQNHYYNLVGPFENWDQVLDYREEYGGYPITVSSQEENLILSQLMGSCDHNEPHEVCTSRWPLYTGLYWDGESHQWRWVNGEDVTYTHWASQPEDPIGSGHFGSYSITRWDAQWEMGTLGADEDTLYWVVWEYEEDSTFEQRLGPYAQYLIPQGAYENILILRNGRFYFSDELPPLTESEEALPEPTETEPPAPTEEETKPPILEIVLSDEELARMEQILTYVAFVDSGAVNPYVGQTQEEWLAHQKELEERFLKLSKPAEDDWSKTEVLLLMGWNKDPALEGGPMPSFYGDPTGMSWSYLESVAYRVMTELFGSYDTNWLDGNVISSGYTTDISGGFVYQPITHLFSENYGTLEIQYIEDLGDGKVAIHGLYQRDNVIEFVYTAQLNPASIIGYQLTGVSYVIQ